MWLVPLKRPLLGALSSEYCLLTHGSGLRRATLSEVRGDGGCETAGPLSADRPKASVRCQRGDIAPDRIPPLRACEVRGERVRVDLMGGMAGAGEPCRCQVPRQCLRSQW